ncbi:hypothetical protein D9M68_449490 [compost metagenome]
MRASNALRRCDASGDCVFRRDSNRGSGSKWFIVSIHHWLFLVSAARQSDALPPCHPCRGMQAGLSSVSEFVAVCGRTPFT